MQTATKALQLLEELERSREQAIQELEAAKSDIESKLARLRYDARPPKAKKQKTCKNCGSAEHTARFHKKVSGSHHEDAGA